MAEVEIGVELQCLCARHRMPFDSMKANMEVVGALVMQRFMNRFTEERDIESAEDMVNNFHEFEASGEAMCCYLGDETMNEVLLATPVSSGNSETDAEQVESLVRGVKCVREFDA